MQSKERNQYRKENGVHLIEMRLHRVRQLFNSLDPAPFREKDLDEDAEAYLVGCAEDFAIKTPFKLVFYLPEDEISPTLAVDIRQGVKNYFDYCLWSSRRALKNHMRQGRTRLCVGLCFLFTCYLLYRTFSQMDQVPFYEIIAEGFIITGWVSMWGPIELLLYDWWPILRQAKLYRKLSLAPVEVRSVVD